MIEEKDLKIGSTYYVLKDYFNIRWKYMPARVKYAGMTYTDETYEGDMVNPIYFFVNGSGHYYTTPWSINNLDLVFDDYQEALKYRTQLLIKYAAELKYEIETPD